MQPINSNNALDAEHTLYVGGTGSGKTSAVKKLGRIKETDQVVFWDPHEDYQVIGTRVVRRHYSLKDFAKAMTAARRTKQGFKLALTMPEERGIFLQFCAIVKGFGNGLHPKKLHVVVEEVPQITASVMAEKSTYGWLLQVGRKFGFVVHSVAQNSTRISKDVLTESPYKWVGMQGSRASADRVRKEIEVSVDDVLALNKLEYYFKSPGIRGCHGKVSLSL